MKDRNCKSTKKYSVCFFAAYEECYKLENFLYLKVELESEVCGASIFYDPWVPSVTDAKSVLPIPVNFFLNLSRPTRDPLNLYPDPSNPCEQIRHCEPARSSIFRRVPLRPCATRENVFSLI